MTKQDLIRDMKQTYQASFLSVTQVAEYRGIHPNSATRLLKGVPYTAEEKGRRKYYFVGDIADRILRDIKVAV